MNERIRKLAEQAGCKVMDDGEWYIPSAVGSEKVVYTSGVGLEKFAELIVEECVECLMPLSRNHSMVGAAQDTIREHFGVEE